MKRTPVQSSSIKSVGHANNTMEIQFASGDVYRYKNVPAAVATALLEAESAGKAFQTLVRGKYAHHKVDKP